MKTYVNTKIKTYKFSSCDICDAKCCSGSNGTIFNQVILDDFFELHNNFPIVFLLGDLGFLKPVVLFTNGKDYCKYLENNRCIIYENRPSVCKIYPLSPHLTNDAYIDLSCPAVGDEGEFIVKEGVVQDGFKDEILKDYKDKYINMHLYFEKFNKKENLEFFTKINEHSFYKFKEDLGDEYLKIHLSSLKNFDSYFTV